jgi:tripartite motif-containing protein 71
MVRLEQRPHRAEMLLMPQPRVLSMVVGLGMCLASCGGSGATSQASHQSSWQVVLTVKTTGSGLNLGITGITFDHQGNLYVAEFDDDVIYKYSTSGNLLATLGGHGSGAGQLEAPDKLAFDAEGNLFVTEVGSASAGYNSRIQKFSPTGVPLAQWGTFGSTPGKFNTPVGIAVDQQGNIYVADVGNHRVQKLSALGQPLTQWHTVGSGVGESTEIGYDLALDASGNVYVSDAHPFSSGSDHIQKFSASGLLLATWGGTGTGPGQFINPTGLAVDGKGNLFVVDSANDRIQEISATGQFVAQWQGPGIFQFTSKVAVDDHGTLYVSDGSQVLKLAAQHS